MKYNDLTIIVPTLNEENNILNLLNLITNLFPEVSVIISDDGSKDRTQELVLKERNNNKNIKLIDRSKEDVKGLTVSVLDGIMQCDTPYFVIIDGDMQHPPEKIKEIYEKLKNYDIVCGYRKKILRDRTFPLPRRIMSKIAILLGQMRLLLNGRLTKDVVSGFFGGNTEFVKKVISEREKKFELRGYKVLFDLLKILPSSARVGYVPYLFGIRNKGESKINKKHVIIYLRSLFK